MDYFVNKFTGLINGNNNSNINTFSGPSSNSYVSISNSNANSIDFETKKYYDRSIKIIFNLENIIKDHFYNDKEKNVSQVIVKFYHVIVKCLRNSKCYRKMLSENR